jgi:hypothetical protein
MVELAPWSMIMNMCNFQLYIRKRLRFLKKKLFLGESI